MSGVNVEDLAEARARRRAEDRDERESIEREPPAEARTAIATAWKPLDPRFLLEPPPPRRWLLKHPTRDHKECAPGQGDGLLPLGKAGLFAADGGVGKTMAFLALGVSVITGRHWLGHFYIADEARKGRVLLALAEEDAEEAHRRLYAVAQSYQLTAEERARVADRLVILPLAGKSISLLAYALDGRTLVDSSELVAMRERLRADAGEHGWSFVGLDPFARWSPDDAEKDNAIATRTLTACETLLEVPGRPTVLLAHHASQIAVRSGEVTSRGATGIKNAARWEGTLREDGADVYFRQTKSNYSRPMPKSEELRLVRGSGGLLRVATEAEEQEREGRASEREADRAAEKDRAKDDARRRRVAELVERIVAVASEVPRSGRELGLAAGLNREDAVAAVAAAKVAGRIVPGDRVKGHDRYTRATS